jgi:hypothetical protein
MLIIKNLWKLLLKDAIPKIGNILKDSNLLLEVLAKYYFFIFFFYWLAQPLGSLKVSPGQIDRPEEVQLQSYGRSSTEVCFKVFNFDREFFYKQFKVESRLVQKLILSPHS